MNPSELREAIEKAVTTAKTLKVGDDKWDDMFYVTKTEQDVDAILDAVIASLPLIDVDDPSYVSQQESGQAHYHSKVRELLQSAKSISKESE